jgi:hypothetical protein
MKNVSIQRVEGGMIAFITNKTEYYELEVTQSDIQKHLPLEKNFEDIANNTFEGTFFINVFVLSILRTELVFDNNRRLYKFLVMDKNKREITLNMYIENEMDFEVIKIFFSGK